MSMGEYFRGLGRSAAQGASLGFSDEIEAGFRALGDGTYEQELAKVRAEIADFEKKAPVAAFASELVGAVPTLVAGGAGLASLGVRGVARIGAIEGGVYGAGTGESTEGRVAGAAIGAPLGAVSGVVGEKVVEGIAPLVGKFMKTRGSGSEVKGSGAIELEAGSPDLEAGSPDLGPMVREAGSDEFVPLVNKVGEPGSSDLGGPGANPSVRTGDDVFGQNSSTTTPSQLIVAKGSFDYSPIDNALANAETLMNAGRKGLTGEQYLARLPNQDSVTKTEMETSGLAAFLSKPENLRRKIPAEDLRTYLDENAPRLNYYREDGGAYEFDQRFMDPDAFGSYGEIAVSNSNTPGLALTHTLSHHADMPGIVAHARFSDHRIVDSDANVLDIRVLEENQFDVLSSSLRQEAGLFVRYPLDKAKVAEFDAEIDKLRDSAGYAQVSQARDAFQDSQVELRKIKEEISEAERGVTDAQFRTSMPAGAVSKNLESFKRLGEQYANLGPARVDASLDVLAPDLLHSMVVSLPEDVVKNGKHKASQAVREALTNPDFSDDRSSQWYRGLYDAVDSFGEASGLTLVEAFDRIAPAMLKTLDGRVGSVTMQNAYEDSVKTVELGKRLQELPLKLEEQQKLTNALEDKATQTAVNFLEENLKGTDTDTMALMNYMTPSGFMPSSTVSKAAKSKFDDYQFKKFTSFGFVPTQPFKTPMQAARNSIYAVVQNALQEGKDRVYFPDYKDLAELREIEPEGFIKTVYKDAPEKVIKELKQVYPGLETGTVSIGDFRSTVAAPDVVRSEAKGNLRYIDLRRIDRDRFKPRRFAQGGKVDLRSGIGDMFRLYS